jgi:hypothetical protein
MTSATILGFAALIGFPLFLALPFMLWCLS